MIIGISNKMHGKSRFYAGTAPRPQQPGKVPPQGTILRCKHGVMLSYGDENEKAFFCQLCACNLEDH